MAPWIAHLRVAEGLISLGALDKVSFAYGSLAPDSGKPNADWTAFDPPKEITHFLNHGESEAHIRDIEFYQDYVLTSPHFEDNLEDYSFRRGYFFHLLCDNLWSRRLMTTYKQLYPELIDNPNHPIWQTTKRDWYDLDFCYLRDNPDCLFWRVIMTTPNPPPYLPFLSSESLNYSLDHIRSFYSASKSERNLDHPYLYLNKMMMDRFIKDCTHTLIKVYFLAVARPQPVLKGLSSYLDLLDLAEYAPYTPPFGDPS